MFRQNYSQRNLQEGEQAEEDLPQTIRTINLTMDPVEQAQEEENNNQQLESVRSVKHVREVFGQKINAKDNRHDEITNPWSNIEGSDAISLSIYNQKFHQQLESTRPGTTYSQLGSSRPPTSHMLSARPNTGHFSQRPNTGGRPGTGFTNASFRPGSATWQQLQGQSLASYNWMSSASGAVQRTNRPSTSGSQWLQRDQWKQDPQLLSSTRTENYRDLLNIRRALARKQIQVSQSQLKSGLVPPEDIRPQSAPVFQFPKPGFFLMTNPLHKTKNAKKGKKKKGKKGKKKK